MTTTKPAGLTEISLTLAIETRDALRAQGVKCQLRFVSDDLWNVLLAGTDY
ncbi:hypothetical protein ACOI8A_28160 [Pseudomonas sp. P4795]|uniref:hypothetical protein n=1 Tax=Pseudomonas sp. P4795 TaxID=3409915 RepID=UPI003B5A8D28